MFAAALEGEVKQYAEALRHLRDESHRALKRLQDRIVRTCIYQNVSTRTEARSALRAEFHRYNSRQIHSTAGAIPNIRFDRARREGNSLFRKFVISEPSAYPQDLF
jgi:hypothetical protein